MHPHFILAPKGISEIADLLHTGTVPVHFTAVGPPRNTLGRRNSKRSMRVGADRMPCRESHYDRFAMEFD